MYTPQLELEPGPARCSVARSTRAGSVVPGPLVTHELGPEG